MAEEKQSYSRRFINAYNEIDYALRVQHGLRRSMGFSDMIRKSVVLNHIVRKYEEDLIDYGRLRNAIIHRSNDEYIIAEPHQEVVESIEKIARILTKPPKLLDKFKETGVMTAQNDVTIKSVIALIASTGFSNIPIYKNGTMIGVANGQKILDVIGYKINDNPNFNVEEYIKKTKIQDIVQTSALPSFYEVLDSDITIEEILDKFYKNSKLLVIIVTKTGSMMESPICVVTKSDSMKLDAIIENY